MIGSQMMAQNRAAASWELEASDAAREAGSYERMPGWARFLWFVSIATGQFYVFDSGNIQPFDAVLFLTCILAVSTYGRVGQVLGQPVVVWFYVFCLLTWVINGAWAAKMAEYGMLMNSLYVTFNVIVFTGVCVSVARWGAQLLRVIAIGCLLSVSITAVAGVVAPGMGGENRVELFFNNPNQMAAHCLATATILFVLRNHLRHLHWTAWAALPVFLWLVLLTSSRAGILSTLMLIVLTIAGSRAVLLGGLLLPALVGALIFLEAQDPRGAMLEKEATSAFGGRELELEDTYEERGYDRLFTFPEHLVLGAGEGAYYRFGSPKELHSSFGTVLFCYGVPGTLALLAFLATWARNNGPRAIFILPMLSYGLTHQGLRQRTFWILLALTQGVTWMVSARKQREEAETAPTPPIRRQPSLPARPVALGPVAERSTS